MSTTWNAFKTRPGWLGLVFREDELLRLVLPQRLKRDVRSRLEAACGPLRARPLPAALEPLQALLEAYFEGELVDPAAARVRLDLSGATPFMTRVYLALRDVPRGRVISYGALAALAGSPRAARGVGTAMARNRFPLLVPCHRVVASDRRIGGFSAAGGVGTKRELLRLEGWDGVTHYR